MTVETPVMRHCARAAMIDSTIVKQRIAVRAEEFVRGLFGDGAKRAGTDKWRVGSRGSLAVEVKDRELVWYSHEEASGGDAIELWRRERGDSKGDALKACAAWAGVAADCFRPALPAVKPHQPATPKQRPPTPNMPSYVLDAWHEGRSHLCPDNTRFNTTAIVDLARWRGWPPTYVETLVRSGTLTAPLYFGTRTRAAFPVCQPVTWPAQSNESSEYLLRDRPRFVGFHARLFDQDGEDPGWRLVPCADKNTGRPSLPPYPLVLARDGAFGQLWDKQVVIVTEGEWDACTLPLAAGWFDAESGLLRIPRALAIVGILGANGGDTFLKSYAPSWPSGLDVLVLRDGDSAGTRWTRKGGFIEQLRARSRRVGSFDCGAIPDGKRRDVNDLLHQGILDRGLLDDLLGDIDWSLTRLESAEPRAA